MRFMCKAYISRGGTLAWNAGWVATASARGGTRPSRRATRCTWVSTGKYGRSSEKRRTHAAVFGPTPGSARSFSHSSASAIRVKAASSSATPSSRTARSIARIRTALVGRRPPRRIARAIAGSGAAATSSHRGKRRRRSAYARSRFVSLVCWERTVRISSSSGGRWRGAGGSPYAFASRRAIARRRRRSMGADRSDPDTRDRLEETKQVPVGEAGGETGGRDRGIDERHASSLSMGVEPALRGTVRDQVLGGLRRDMPAQAKREDRDDREPRMDPHAGRDGDERQAQEKDRLIRGEERARGDGEDTAEEDEQGSADASPLEDRARVVADDAIEA